jgi:hypothetical protein
MECPISGPVEVGDRPRRLALGELKPHALPAVLPVHANRVAPTHRQPDEQWTAAKNGAEQRPKPQLPGIRSRAPPDTPELPESALRPFSYRTSVEAS